MIVSTQTQVPVPAGSHCRNADIGQIKETRDGRVHGTGPCSWPTITSCVRSAPFPRVNPLAPPASMVGSGSTGRPTAGLAFRGTEARAPSTRSHFILPRRHPRCAGFRLVIAVRSGSRFGKITRTERSSGKVDNGISPKSDDEMGLADPLRRATRT
jgi:hypothetical protein